MSEPIRSMRVIALAIKPAHEAPMRIVNEARAIADAGLDGGVRPAPDRGLTLLASRQWEQVQSELNTDLSWHLRRANVLLEADHLRDLIGQRVRIGQAVVDVLDETRPCWLMDAQHRGLLDALRPEMRGGVCGRIVTSGLICAGDMLTVMHETPHRGDA